MRDVPTRAWLYLAAVAAAASFGTLGWARAEGLPPIGPVLGFGLLFLAAEFAPVRFPHVSYSVGFVVAIAATISGGPAVAALAATFAALDVELRKRRDWPVRIVFNAAQFCLSTLALATVYRLTGGPSGAVAVGDFPVALVPTALGTGAFFATNTTLVSIMVRLVRRIAWREVWHSDYRLASATYFSFAALGVIFSALYSAISWWAVPFVVVPLAVARHAFQTSHDMQSTFDKTLESLVTAIEAKDRYTRGHAERVSRLAGMIARAHGLPESTVRRIRYAALMHDVGKVTVDTRILQKPGKLSAEEFDHMKVHTIRGADLVGEIDLLIPMVDAVRHHHERLDGRGYPDGLGGEALSAAARIIMVADAFDSMTSTRSYRKAMPVEAALAELRRCQGTQFAPEMIDALEQALGRWGWSPAPEPYVGELTPRPDASPHAALG